MSRQLTLKISLFLLVLAGILGPQMGFTQDHHIDSDEKDLTEEGYDPTNTTLHHISDQNVYSLGFAQIPLPMILYAPEDGLKMFSSGKFGIGHHGNGHYAVDRYVLVEGVVRRITDKSFPGGKVALEDHPYTFQTESKEDGADAEVVYLSHNGNTYRLDNKSTLDGGVLGGGLTSFYDFSITKNIVTMVVAMLLLLWVFLKSARRYKDNPLQAPKGIQSFLEPIFIFIRDEVAKPFLGAAYLKYLPFLMTLFFLILTLNFIGQIPFIGNPNVTGNLTFTLALAFVTFIVVNINGTKAYWQHTFWMPGVPTFVKPIMSVVEFIGLFLKPIVLTLRLAANITAGHIMIVIFVSLLFIFNNAGQNMAGSAPGLLLSSVLAMFMMALEIIVSLVQAFVFTILSASYIGAAIEEAH
ncbi:F0F1 ATP synthase subunit A [Membranicola marinus]|uniref:ATP synthase subunit a n=1 Tax=Membranihabitans marinus TaxID=1227546 RepID=A0A953LCW9_9BACT|nr:F0F1 ATP synthase subunit A [Membranihabitans marinus]MBY5958229.1 F0F1 ATP synthase subunit A [Membranihabitans marinus]